MSEQNPGLDVLNQERRNESAPVLHFASFEHRLLAEEAERRAGVETVVDSERGLYIIVESDSLSGAPAAKAVSQLVYRNMVRSETEDLTERAGEAVSAVNTMLGISNSQENKVNHDRVSLTMLQVAQQEDGTTVGYVTSVGGGKAFKYVAGDESGDERVELNDEADAHDWLDGSEDVLAKVEYIETDINKNDRIGLVSRAVSTNYSDKGLTKGRHKGAAAGGIYDSAKALTGKKSSHRDKVAIVVDAVPHEEGGASHASEAAAPKEKKNKIREWFAGKREAWNQSRAQKQKKVGRHAVGAAGIENPQEVDDAARGRHTRHAKRGVWDRANGAIIDFQGNRSERQQSRHDRYVASRWNDKRYKDKDDDYRRNDIEKRYDSDKKAVIVGLAALGAAGVAAAYWLSFDHGNDKGIDLLTEPFDTGDINDGDGDGADINWRNLSPQNNDDPTVAHWDQSGALDLAPAWLDGDPMDFEWDGTDETLTWDPGDTNLPDPRLAGSESDGFADAINSIFDRINDIAEDVANGGNSSSTVELMDIPDNFVWERGHGYTQEYKDVADLMGISDQLRPEDYYEINKEMISEHGEDHVTTPGHNPDTYVMANGDIGITAPSENASWASEDVEEALQEKLRARALHNFSAGALNN